MRRFARAFLHSHAFLKRGPPPSLCLSFSSLASSPEAAELGKISTGALEKRITNVRKARKLKAEKIGCGSLHADTSISIAEKSRHTIKSKAKVNAAGAKAAKLLESENAHVREIAAMRKEMTSLLHAKSVFEEEKTLPNAAVDRTDEIAVNAAEGANDGMAHAKKELSKWAAKLDLNSSNRGLKWMETADKLLDYGISSAHVKRMLQKCRNLRCVHSSDSILEHFTMLGMSHDDIGYVISVWPTVLNLSDNVFRSKVEFFESVGIDRYSLGKIMHKAYRLMEVSLSVLRGRYEFWNDYFQDVAENAFHTMVSKHPQVLSWNLQKTVKPNLAYLEELGLSFDKKALLRGSPLLSYSVNRLALKLELLEQIGALNARNLRSSVLVLQVLSIVKLHERLHNLFAFGFSFDHVKKLMVVCPQVLAYTEDRSNLRLSYAVNVLNISLDVLAGCTPFWSCSFEKRIKYRCEVLKKLRTLGVLGKDYSLGYMLVMSDAKFSTEVLKKLQAYTKDFPMSDLHSVP